MPEIQPMSIRSFKTELFDQFARVAKALSSGVRLEILDLLAQKEYSVETLSDMLGQSFQNMSRHLQVLKQAKLVSSRKDGNFVHYRLTDEDVSDLVMRLQAVSQRHLAEVDEVLERFQSHATEFEMVSIDDVIERAKHGDVIVLDVRPPGEFAQGHLPHATNIPLSQLQSRLGELPADKKIIAYCRGRYCLMAYAAVDYLQAQGLAAERMGEGVVEWKLQHQMLEQG